MSERDAFESTDPFDSPDPFESQDREGLPEKKKGLSGCAIAGIGCGILVVLLLIAVVIGALWVRDNARNFGTDFTVTMMKEGLKELDVPDDQRQRMHARIDEVGNQFKEGKIDLKQVTAIFEKINEGPLMPAGVLLFVKRVYVRDSGLEETEKEAAHVAFRRFARGVIDNSIPEEKREAILDMISTKDSQGNRQFKEKLTDTELRAFVEAVSKTADEAGVPTEIPEINFADEFDKAVDEALGHVGGASSSQSTSSSNEPLKTTAEESAPNTSDSETSALETVEPSTEE